MWEDCRYVVHPRAFLVHRPHPASDAKKQFTRELGAAAAAAAAPGDAAGFSISGATERFFGEQCKAGSSFKVLVTPGFRRCRDRLEHWDVFGPSGEAVPTMTDV